MELPAIADMLGRTELFGPLSEADRATIAGRMRRVEFTPDQMIFSRGDPGREIYLVVEGRIRLSILSSDGRELSFAHAGPGSIFGEIATLDGGERTAGATAISRVEAITLHRIEVRLARLILSALKAQPAAAKGQKASLDLGMSQSELALLIGAS